MVPFFRRRSIVVLLLGLIVGALGGLGFWAISPVEVETEIGWPPISFESEPDRYESTTKAEVFPTGTAYADLKSLQREGEYYAAKMLTSTFLEYLSETLEGHQYYHSPSELEEMLMVRYDYKDNEVPSVEIKATAPSENEAYYLALIVPEVFKDYMATMEQTAQLEEYQELQQLFDSTSNALVEARINRAKLAAAARVSLDGIGASYLDGLSLNLDYVVVDAEVMALERQLGNISGELASFNISGFQEPEITSRLVIGDPSEPELVPPDRMRGRNVLMIGALLGVVVAWVGVNYGGLMERMRPAPAAIVRLREEEEEEEETEE